MKKKKKKQKKQHLTLFIPNWTIQQRAEMTRLKIEYWPELNKYSYWMGFTMHFETNLKRTIRFKKNWNKTYGPSF